MTDLRIVTTDRGQVWLTGYTLDNDLLDRLWDLRCGLVHKGGFGAITLSIPPHRVREVRNLLRAI